MTCCPCTTLGITVTILRAGTAKSYVVTVQVLKLTKTNAVLGADLDNNCGRRIATITLVPQLITDISRLT